jgi:hypothetical protein
MKRDVLAARTTQRFGKEAARAPEKRSPALRAMTGRPVGSSDPVDRSAGVQGQRVTDGVKRG